MLQVQSSFLFLLSGFLQPDHVERKFPCVNIYDSAVHLCLFVNDRVYHLIVIGIKGIVIIAVHLLVLDQFVSFETFDIQLNVHILFPVSVDEEYRSFTVFPIKGSRCIDIRDVIIVIHSMEVIYIESFCRECRSIDSWQDRVPCAKMTQLIERIVNYPCLKARASRFTGNNLTLVQI